MDYTEQNRRAWNEIAAVRERMWPGAEFFAAGGSLLPEPVVAAAGEVAGRRVLHLQCATGEETLSWAVLGAVATGADISDEQIAIAQRKASEAGLSVAFVAADIYALPEGCNGATSTSSIPVAGRSSGCRISRAGPGSWRRRCDRAGG